MNVYELNLDGLVGSTHHYAGLSPGNLASTSNALSVANPKAAALEGLNKMRLIHELGIKQALLPPHQRPNLHLLHQLGFGGSPAQQIASAKKTSLTLLSACYSASSMWTANAATVSPSQDTKNQRVHFTAANLVSHLHRHQEANFSHFLLKTLFANEEYFNHHFILPKTMVTSDEGAANHNRLCASHQDSGLHLFVYGKKGLTCNNPMTTPKKFPARQTLEASQAIARSHQLDLNHVVFAQQNPAAIDQGVFHNDVIAVANESVLLLHEHAFINQSDVLHELSMKAAFPLNIIEISNQQLSVAKAVKSYFFNSQLMTVSGISEAKSMILLAPKECEEDPAIQSLIHDLINSDTNPIHRVHYLSLKQSMQNGGGPACLRLRVPLNEAEFSSMHKGVLINEALLKTLEAWVKTHYRSELHANDLADPHLINESFQALDELTSILKLGSIYPFQKETTD